MEQLRLLPVEDLLQVCEANRALAEICRDPTLWRLRIQDLGIQADQIADPRSFYLGKVLFGGQIYIDFIEERQFRLLPHQIIPYNQLYATTRRIAEELGRPYLIVYWRVADNPDKFELQPMGYQIQDDATQLGPEKITLVDIVVDPAPWMLETVRNAIMLQNIAGLLPLGLGQVVDYHGEQLHSTDITRKQLITQPNLPRLWASLEGWHKNLPTPFYQREMARLSEQHRAVMMRAVPSIPPLRIEEGDLATQKQQLIDFTTGNLAPIHFSPEFPYLGFRTYPDFAFFQENYIGRLDPLQVQTLLFLRHQIIPVARVLEERSSYPFAGFVLDSEGHLVFL